MRFGFFITLVTLSLNIWAADLSDRQQIEERIKPIGQVNLAEQATPATSTKPAVNPTVANLPQEDAGKATYEQYCSVCHRDGLAGAPKFRDAKDWQSRIDKKAIDDLVASANKGLNAMPIKGTCSECSDEDLKNAIQYMLPQP
ncbi:Cytochrome c5 [Legionella massiliensis]|uniref:Cytochrome c5 n=1 Tax=Legionella massiliensis TaxID=1034943 RepID=A0A078KU21_9GAMM|nr:c-type cytochrome [Legionella massiliensis]CDZ77920.1 Cytochrome c5 [Legionella massiliensis]CEE13658.1 Cytochrome c5 [Legionella massiliensis]